MNQQIQWVQVVLPLEVSESRDAWVSACAKALGIRADQISDLRLAKHSIDARHHPIKVQLKFEVSLHGPLAPAPVFEPRYPVLDTQAPTVIIVGCGPAGMFAALRCLEKGYRPIILERGKPVYDRRYDLPKATRFGEINPESNYCFGEGGAGTFSDGKLYTRSKKRGDVNKIYETLVAHGAPSRILIDAHPHIGSNLLPKVVMRMRESIRAAGGEIHFSTRVNDFLVRDGRVQGVVSRDGQAFEGVGVILATGHSGREIYELFHAKAWRLEPKAFAVGVRIEHPQPLIDSIQYHTRGAPRHTLLPAARYALATKIEGRGVHSFCMCPGGFIVPAATCNDEVVVNGMSLSRRDSPFANSGMVVSVEPEDLSELIPRYGVLAGMHFQKELEVRAKQLGGHGQRAPGQRLVDFLEGKLSSQLPDTSYVPGVHSVRLDEALPAGIVSRLKVGLKLFGRDMKGYISEEALMIGVETRTSSPVRIPRDQTTLMHPDILGLFPCGEGAGYAGGIASAAIDGVRCADALIAAKAQK